MFGDLARTQLAEPCAAQLIEDPSQKDAQSMTIHTLRGRRDSAAGPRTAFDCVG